jgi:PAS domain S-box-containing protein
VNLPYKNIEKPLRIRLLRSYLIVTLPVSVLLLVIVELFEVPYVQKSALNELTNYTKLVTSMIHNSATIAIRNHLKAIAEKNKEVIIHYYEIYKKNEISFDEFNQRVRSYLIKQKIGTSGYPYIINSKGILEFHRYKELEKRSFYEYDFVQKQAQFKEGYLEYQWKNPGEKVERPKALYMTYFEPLDWIISASSYREEFNELVNIDDFRDMVLSLKIIKNGYVYILDSTGKALLHPFMPKYYNIFEESGKDNSFVKYMLENKSGYVEYKWQNPQEPKPLQKIAFFEHVPVFNWIVVSTGYADDVYKSVYLIRISSYLLVLLLLTGGIIVSSIFSRRISKPIEDTVKQITDNISSGINNKLIINTQDEIQFLVEEINKYLGKIEEQTQEIISQRLRYNNLFETSPVGILILQDLKIIDCNPACTELFEIDKSELINKNIIDLSKHQQLANIPSSELFLKFLNETKNASQTVTFEWEFCHKNEIITNIYVKSFSDNEDQFVLFIIDITQERKYQQKILELNESLEIKVAERTEELQETLKKLEQANLELKILNEDIIREAHKLQELNEKLVQSEERLREANLTKDKFISILAHDLRNPIGGIRTVLETLKLMITENEKLEDLVKLINVAYNASKNTYDLLENLLQWARLQREGITYQPEISDLYYLIENTIQLVKPNADNKQIKIINFVQSNTLAYFDEFIIQTVLRNLLNNAIKYSYENSEITISLEEYKDDNNFWVVSVKDNGIGIEDEVLKNLFHIERIKSTPGTNGEKGSGLGLILCKEYIEKANGKLFVQSEVGKGTIFSFTVPKNVII